MDNLTRDFKNVLIETGEVSPSGAKIVISFDNILREACFLSCQYMPDWTMTVKDVSTKKYEEALMNPIEESLDFIKRWSNMDISLQTLIESKEKMVSKTDEDLENDREIF